MSKKRAPGRSLDEWMELVTECRQSGLTDAAWCNEHGISPSCFYNAVTRLRKKVCQIPDPVGKASTLDLTSHKQDVVQIAGFSSWVRYLAGLFTKTGNRIVKTAGRNPMFIAPCSIRQTALSAFGYQIHSLIQGTPWGTFVSHNETSICSEFLSPINGV